MKWSFKKNILILQLALLIASLVVISGCWIPLAEETAMVVEVFDAQGGPVDGVNLLLDSSDTIVTGSQRDAGQVFVSLSQEGDHTIQLDTATLIDPQGGVGWMPLAYQVSGDISALAFTNKPFVGSSDVLVVPVNKGEITVVTFYLDDILKSPMDNQWLTDGLDTSNDYRTTDTNEFTNSPTPTFWWKQDPSLGETVNFTFQLWRDDDGDTRYPLGVINDSNYNAFSKTPDWEESNQAMFDSVAYSSGSTVWPLGWTYAYAGSPLGTTPPEGEYVWRVIQENPVRGVSTATKLSAFYTYSGYYYASTESGGLDMSGTGPSANAKHRDIFSMIDGATPAGVMETPFDTASTNRYRQRTAAQYSDSLAAGFGTANQISVFYPTDAEGKVSVSSLLLNDNIVAFLDVLLQNKESLISPSPPHMQGKTVRLAYESHSGDQIVPYSDVDRFWSEDIFYLGQLIDEDYQDPLW
jgi:hypothetical protein